MNYTFEQLKEMTVARLREIAKEIEHEELKGVATMHKDKLLPALCKALGIEAHAHHQAVGINKSGIKAEIRKMKGVRDEALARKDDAGQRAARKQIHKLKRKLRRTIR
ncbi:MAG: hypothetical protein WB626_13005 [Bacteroidota bacterium]